MKHFFKYKNYREVIKDLSKIHNYKIKDLARVTRCSHSYLSQVLTAEKANLNKDQGLRLALEFNLKPKEIQFFLLHIDWANAGSVELRNYIELELEKISSQEMQPDKTTKAQLLEYNESLAAKYFSDYNYMVAHLATACPNYQKIDLITDRLHISKKQAGIIVNFLLENQLIKEANGKLIYNGSANIHLKKDSLIYKNYHQVLRINALLKNNKDNYNYSSLFAIEKKDLKEIQFLLSDFITKKEEITSSSGSDDVYLLCLDLMRA